MGLCHSLVRSDQQAANSLAHGFQKFRHCLHAVGL